MLKMSLILSLVRPLVTSSQPSLVYLKSFNATQLKPECYTLGFWVSEVSKTNFTTLKTFHSITSNRTGIASPTRTNFTASGVFLIMKQSILAVNVEYLSRGDFQRWIGQVQQKTATLDFKETSKIIWDKPDYFVWKKLSDRLNTLKKTTIQTQAVGDRARKVSFSQSCPSSSNFKSQLCEREKRAWKQIRYSWKDAFKTSK